MNRLATRLLVLGLVWSMTPGLAEVTENLWHLVVAGHSAHAVEAGSDHAPIGDEHGCSGLFHLCSCHHTPPTTLMGVEVVAAGNSGADRIGAMVTGSFQDPFLPGPFRPPRA